jgi:hypothetical protein
MPPLGFKPFGASKAVNGVSFDVLAGAFVLY